MIKFVEKYQDIHGKDTHRFFGCLVMLLIQLLPSSVTDPLLLILYSFIHIYIYIYIYIYPFKLHAIECSGSITTNRCA